MMSVGGPVAFMTCGRKKKMLSRRLIFLCLLVPKTFIMYKTKRILYSLDNNWQCLNCIWIYPNWVSPAAHYLVRGNCGPLFGPFYRGKHTICTEGGVKGGCNNKHYWLMELLLDRTNYFNRLFGWRFVCQNFSARPRRFLIFLSCESETAT